MSSEACLGRRSWVGFCFFFSGGRPARVALCVGRCWSVYRFDATIYTSVIAPMFNKFVPLEDGELRESLDAYAKESTFH